jgi:hypothetical protein
MMESLVLGNHRKAFALSAKKKHFTTFRKTLMDTKLRTLARQAKLGDPQAKAAWIVERVRAGELSNFRIELASWLGDSGAQLIYPIAAATSEHLSKIKGQRDNRNATPYLRRNNFDPDICWEAQIHLEYAISRFRDWRPTFRKAHPHLIFPERDEIQTCLELLCKTTKNKVRDYLLWLPNIPEINNKLAEDTIAAIIAASSNMTLRERKDRSVWLGIPRTVGTTRITSILFNPIFAQYRQNHYNEHPWLTVAQNIVDLMIQSMFSEHRLDSWGLRTLREEIQHLLQIYKYLAFHLGWLLETSNKANILCGDLADSFLGWE